MATIYDNYPHGLKDKDIENAIGEYTQEIYKAKAGTNAVLQFSPLIQLGQNELQGRHTRRATQLSVGVAFLSLAIAGSALYVSLTSSRSNERWETNQLQSLESINIDINKSSNTLSETMVKQNTKTTDTLNKVSKEVIEHIKAVKKEKAANKSLKSGTAKSAAP